MKKAGSPRLFFCSIESDHVFNFKAFCVMADKVPLVLIASGFSMISIKVPRSLFNAAIN
jgi:hypothetical protein